jgi:hypothetical protein
MMRDLKINHSIIFKSGPNIYNLRNHLLEGNNTSKRGDPPFKGMPYTHILWIDSDMVYNPDDALRLIASEKPITGALYCDVYNKLTCGKWNIEALNREHFMPRYTMQELQENVDDEGYVPVDWQGFGLLAIRHGVCESMGFPWFKAEQLENDDYEYLIGEDIWFCRKAKEKGFQSYIDMGVSVGHRKLKNLYPIVPKIQEGDQNESE